jgi:hypothetical protein
MQIRVLSRVRVNLLDRSMSGGNDLSNLPEPIKGLVQAFTSQSTSDALPMEEGMEVQEWIGKAARPGAYSQPTDLKVCSILKASI